MDTRMITRAVSKLGWTLLLSGLVLCTYGAAGFPMEAPGPEADGIVGGAGENCGSEQCITESSLKDGAPEYYSFSPSNAYYGYSKEGGIGTRQEVCPEEQCEVQKKTTGTGECNLTLTPASDLGDDSGEPSTKKVYQCVTTV